MRDHHFCLSKIKEAIRASLNLKSEMGILYVYRFISLVLTTIFYVFANDRLPVLYKAGVVATLCISSILVLGIYDSFHKSRKSIPWAVVLVETLGICILLIPTGGLSSPFMWYALNPVLVSICFLTTFFSWINLLFYCCAAAMISFFLFNPSGESLLTLVSAYSNVFLVFALITYAVQLLARLLHKSEIDAAIIQQRKQELEEANHRLTQANETIKASMEHIMALYQCVGALNAQTDKKAILQMFAEYAVTLSGAKSAYYYPLCTQFYRGSVIFAGNPDGLIGEGILQAAAADIELGDSTRMEEVSGYLIAVAGIKTSYGLCGLLGTVFEGTLCDDKKDLILNQLYFLAQLCGTVLERFVLEEVENHLLIAQEQNRIANQMHDSVSQRLFSIVCAIHSMAARWEELDKNEVKSQLDLIADCASSASRELRTCIYELSGGKRNKWFFNSIKHYLEELSRLNGIEVKVNFVGNDSMLMEDMKATVNRIIREATSNAIRHGRCSKIEASIHISHESVQIRIADDGLGMVPQKRISEGQGLGLHNMRSMAQRFNGNFSVNSKLGEGTQIEVVLLLNHNRTLISGGVC